MRRMIRKDRRARRPFGKAFTVLCGGRAMKRTSLPLPRREFIALIGGAAAWPLAAHAQQAAMPVIGFVNPTSAQSWARPLSAFLKGLSETGYVEGRNVAIEYRWAEGRYDRLPAMVADLVRRPGSVVAAATTPAAVSAKATNQT